MSLCARADEGGDGPMSAVAFLRVASMLALAALPAHGQDAGAPPSELPVLEACLAECDTAECDRACEGRATAACGNRMAPDMRDTTLGIAQCEHTEFAAWDAVLNALWPGVRAEAEASGIFDDLLAAQRAWIAWRDAECTYRTAVWGDGSMRRIAWPACRARLTADRVIDLRAQSREGGL